MNTIESRSKKLRSLCKSFHVDKMYLFGSAAKNTLTDQSDIDFVVKFHSIDLASYFENYFNFKEQLKALFNRDVDLLEEQTIKNPILLKSINESKQLIYG